MFSVEIVQSLALAGAITAIFALLAQITTRLRRREREETEKEAERISQALQKQQAARTSTVIEIVDQSVTTGLSPEQLTTLADKIAQRLASNPESEFGSRAIENLIDNYHKQALTQARAQFWLSVGAATVGFVWIVFKGGDIRVDNFATAAPIVPGVVIDAVAALFFKQASETRQRATELYDRLRRDKQMSHSISLVASIEDNKVRSAVKAQIALHMSGQEPNPLDLGKFL